MKNILDQEDINRINTICIDCNIKKFSINNDGSIDVYENVNLDRKTLTELPLIFNKVEGWFDCRMNKLTTLFGAPKYVTSSFICSDNDLITLEGAPYKIDGNFVCSYNKLTSLIHSPKYLRGKYTYMGKLTSIEGLPIINDGEYEISANGLPSALNSFLFDKSDNDLSQERIKIFAKYQEHYNVWIPEFNEDGFNDLRDDINDGLL